MFDDADIPARAGLIVLAIGIVLVLYLFASAGQGGPDDFRLNLIRLLFQFAGGLIVGQGLLDGGRYLVAERRRRAPAKKSADRSNDQRDNQ